MLFIYRRRCRRVLHLSKDYNYSNNYIKQISRLYYRFFSKKEKNRKIQQPKQAAHYQPFTVSVIHNINTYIYLQLHTFSLLCQH